MIEVTYRFEDLACSTSYTYKNSQAIADKQPVSGGVSSTDNFPVIIDTDGLKYKPSHYSEVGSLTLGSLALTPAGIFSTLELVYYGFGSSDIVLVVEKIV